MASARLGEHLKLPAIWARQWRMRWGMSKCSVTVLTRQQMDPKKPRVEFNNSTLLYMKHPRYLGVWLDRKLSFKYHLAKVQAKASRRLGFIRYVARYQWRLRTRQFLTLYRSYVRPVMEFVPFLWQSAAKSDLSELQRIQHRALRTACGADKTSSGRTLEVYCDVLPLKYRWDLLGISWLDRMRRLPDDFPTSRLIKEHQRSAGTVSGTSIAVTVARQRQLRRGLGDADATSTVVVRDGIPPSEDTTSENMMRASVSLKRRVERKKVIKSALRTVWIDEWTRGWPVPVDEEDTPWDHLSRISNGLPWDTLMRLGSVGQQNIMAALRLGHAPVAVHRLRLGRAQSADCECKEGHESVSHFLLECTRWHDQRRRMLGEVHTAIGTAQARRRRRIPVTESLLLGAGTLTRKEYIRVMRAVTAFVLATKGDTWRYIYHR